MIQNIRYLVLWTTDACTLNCSYCYAKAGPRGTYMDFETARKAIDLCQEPFIVQLAGGEPLINFQLVQQVHSYLKNRQLKARLQLQTNGTLIDESMAQALAKMSIAIGISLDGPMAVNEVVRGGTADTVRGIQALGAAGVMVNLNCVVTDQSIESIDQLVDWAFYFGNVGGIGLDLLRETGRGAMGTVQKASSEQISKNLEKAYERSRYLLKTFGRHIGLREVAEAKGRLSQGKQAGHYCYAAAGSALTVLPGGDLYPCGSLVGMNPYYMGNLHQLETCQPKALTLKSPEVCKGCSFQRVCPGACPARVIANGGELGFSEEDCTLRKTAFKIAEKELAQCSNSKK